MSGLRKESNNDAQTLLLRLKQREEFFEKHGFPAPPERCCEVQTKPNQSRVLSEKSNALFSTSESKSKSPLFGIISQPVELYSNEYFALCGLGGILSCGLTHTAVTPIDLVKCNTQANPKEFPNSMVGFRKIYSGQAVSYGFDSGLRGLIKGWGPTLWGYSVQGLCKFGFYEYFKNYFSKFTDDPHKYRDLIYLCASASAEFIADIGLCPFEAVKVRVQTNPAYARGITDGMVKFVSNEGFANLYAGIGPLWARQIPYTIIKFMAFERIAEAIYKTLPKPKSEMNTLEQMGVVFTAGYIAGLFCGAVSHPADTIVSKINKLKMEGSLIQKVKLIYSGTDTLPGIGFRGLWKGFGPRVFMVGTLTGLQWFIYGAFKSAVGLPTPGVAK
jgi:solute carrier family 25 phosphate transporter 3